MDHLFLSTRGRAMDKTFSKDAQPANLIAPPFRSPFALDGSNSPCTFFGKRFSTRINMGKPPIGAWNTCADFRARQSSARAQRRMTSRTVTQGPEQAKVVRLLQWTDDPFVQLSRVRKCGMHFRGCETPCPGFIYCFKRGTGGRKNFLTKRRTC